MYEGRAREGLYNSHCTRWRTTVCLHWTCKYDTQTYVLCSVAETAILMRNTTFVNRLHVRNSVRIIEVSDNRGTDNRGRTVHVKLAACQVRDSSVTQPTPIIITQDCSTGALPHKGQKRPLSWHHTRYANIIISISEANNKCRARKLNILVPNTRARVQIIRSANCTAKSKQKKTKSTKKETVAS